MRGGTQNAAPHLAAAAAPRPANPGSWLLRVWADTCQLLPALWLTAIYLEAPLFILLQLYMMATIPLLRVVLPAWWLWITVGPGRTTAGTGRWPPVLRGLRIWQGLAGYFPARLIKTAELPPGGRYLLAIHPHGVAGCAVFVGFSSGALGFDKLFPGLNLRQGTLRMHFMIPFAREYVLSHGYTDVSPASCAALLRHPSTALVLAVGGGAEALRARPGTMDLVLRRRKGFVRQALQAGAALVPVIAFGENELLRAVKQAPGGVLDRLSRLTRRLWGFTLPLAYGQGVLGLSCGPLPLRQPLNIVVGAPLQLPHYTGDLRSEEGRQLVEGWHGRYITALQQLWEENREQYGQPGVDMRLVE